MAVKILIKRKFKDGNLKAAARLLINHRNAAMQQPGYISSETMQPLEDPNQITVVGTVVVTISVAVSPKSLQSQLPQWFTMATQIRPLDLQAAVTVNNAGGAIYLPPMPKSLPMSFPSNYYP